MTWRSKIRRLTGKLGSTPALATLPTAQPPTQGEPVLISGDNPIEDAKDDVLGRDAVARAFAQQVVALDLTQGVVVGVLGAWGAGKTSFINLARPELRRAGVAVLDFNPWMFSGSEQLVESFFFELAAQLKLRPGLAKLGGAVEDYGEVFSGMGWLPVVGPWIERGRGAAKLFGRLLQRRKEGVAVRRAQLRMELAKLDRPIAVALDDIDRLTTSEIRDVFRLVRLTASFPNVIYIVAFDRVRVEGALAEHGVPGRDYLEKILQLAIDLPAIPDKILHQQVLSAMDGALSNITDPGPFDEHAWPDLFMEVVRPLIRNIRDVRRYAMAVRGTVRALEGQIALADVLALEAIRVFLPDVFHQLHRCVDGLTTASGVMSAQRDDPPRLRAQIDELIRVAETHDDVVRAMINRLFPAAQRHIGGSHFGNDWKTRWLRDRRIAHENILELYLERVMGDELRAFADSERARALMADRQEFDRYLRSLDPARIEDVVRSLEVFEDQYTSDQVVPATIVLLNLLPILPERQRGMFDFGSRLAVTRVTYRLLRSLEDPSAVEDAVRQILPHVESLSSRLELIDDVGHREHVGHGLVSETAAAEFEKVWRDEVRAASAAKLAAERGVLRILLATKRHTDPTEVVVSVPDAPELTLAVLQDARTEVLSQPMDSRAVRRSARLAWDALTEVYGDEVTLRARLDALKATRPRGVDDLLELADKYLTGWRPEHSDE